MQPTDTNSTQETIYQNILEEHYHLKEPKLRRLSIGCNATYLAESGEKKYILRIYLHEQRTLNDIQQEIRLIDHLAKSNVPVQQVIPATSGNLPVKLPAQAGRYMLLLEFIDGEVPKEFNEEQCYYFGRALALVHKHSDELQIKMDKHALLPGWISEFACREVEGTIPGDPRIELLREISLKLAAGIESFRIPEEKPYYGVCHADYYQMNALWMPGNECAVIDFDLMAHGYRAYDAAMFLWNLTIRKKIEPADKSRLWNAYLKAYNEIRELSKEELASIDHFVALYQVYLLGARVQAGRFRGAFPEGYWEENFDYLTTWVATRCNINVSYPGYPNL